MFWIALSFGVLEMESIHCWIWIALAVLASSVVIISVGGGVRAHGQVFGEHDTVLAQNSLENTKWVWGPYRRLSCHPDETR